MKKQRYYLTPTTEYCPVVEAGAPLCTSESSIEALVESEDWGNIFEDNNQ